MATGLDDRDKLRKHASRSGGEGPLKVQPSPTLCERPDRRTIPTQRHAPESLRASLTKEAKDLRLRSRSVTHSLQVVAGT